MTEPARAPDELDDRIRDLEAERLRPVPGWHKAPNPEDLIERERIELGHRADKLLRRLDRLGRKHHPDTDEQGEAST